MSQARTDKVKLSFNAGQYSPFLDSRVDIDKAAAATRTQRNVLSEVGGTARRRPGLRYVLTTNPGAGQEEPLVNYVEFPYLQRLLWRADSGRPNEAYGVEYRGLVRVWESGTLQFVGEGRSINSSGALPNDPPIITEISYKIWSGGDPGVDDGQLHTVFTVPMDEAWYDVDWAEKPAPGDSFRVIQGETPTGVPVSYKILLWEYPTGLIFPIDAFGGLPMGAQGVTASEVSRSGNDIQVDWAYQSPATPTTAHHIWSWYVDSSDWSLSDFIVHVSKFGVFEPSGSGSFTRTIPDSATIGLRFFIAQSHTNEYTGTFDFGPIFRTAYSTPPIQQGIDPVP